ILEKKEIYQDKYTSELIQNESWIKLKESVESPVYSFQDMYFNYIFNKLISEQIGENFAIILEEVLRDEVVTEREKKYLYEKADETGVDKNKVKEILEEYSSINLAFRKIIYEICKDGKITPAEKKYLVEKARYYNITKHKIIDEINQVEKTISKINDLFRDQFFYLLVNLIFLANFFNIHSNFVNEILSRIYKSLNDIDGSSLNTQFLSKDLMNKIVSSINMTYPDQSLLAEPVSLKSVL
ncbi:unnamed protein product, partial [marine sediment metagenome]